MYDAKMDGFKTHAVKMDSTLRQHSQAALSGRKKASHNYSQTSMIYRKSVRI